MTDIFIASFEMVLKLLLLKFTLYTIADPFLKEVYEALLQVSCYKSAWVSNKIFHPKVSHAKRYIA